MKAESRWPAGEDHAVLPTRSRRIPTLHGYLHCRDLRSPGVTERRNGPLGLRDDDDDGDEISK